MKLWGRRQEWRHKIKDGEKKQAVEKCSEHRRGEVKRKEEAKEYKKRENRRSRRKEDGREEKKQKNAGNVRFKFHNSHGSQL